MPFDPNAGKQTINYSGGSLTMSLGALQSLFPAGLDALTSQGENKSVTVSSHQRTRVIGGDATAVSGHTYSYMQWPTSESGQAAGGSVVYMQWTGSEGEWTARVTGSFADLGLFLSDQTSSGVTFVSQRGTKYGPF